MIDDKGNLNVDHPEYADLSDELKMIIESCKEEYDGKDYDTNNNACEHSFKLLVCIQKKVNETTFEYSTQRN